MKSIKLVITAFSLCFLALSSCKKDDTTFTSSSLSMNVDGVSKKSTTMVAASAVVADGVLLSISAQFPNEESISITVADPKVGSFNIENGGVLVFYNSPTATFIVDSGSLTITSLTSNYIKGTFKVTCKSILGDEVKTITAGTFEGALIK